METVFLRSCDAHTPFRAGKCGNESKCYLFRNDSVFRVGIDCLRYRPKFFLFLTPWKMVMDIHFSSTNTLEGGEFHVEMRSQELSFCCCDRRFVHTHLADMPNAYQKIGAKVRMQINIGLSTEGISCCTVWEMTRD